MEEIKEAASAFYEVGPVELTEMAETVFGIMDVDGDGWVSITEFESFLHCNGYNYAPTLFSEIDRDGNNFLNLEEVKVFLYMTQTWEICDGCRSFVMGTYFTCTHCIFEGNGIGYNLCRSCYRTKRLGEGHGPFVDNYSILLSMRKQHLHPMLLMHQQSLLPPQQQHQPQPQPQLQSQPQQQQPQTQVQSQQYQPQVQSQQHDPQPQQQQQPQPQPQPQPQSQQDQPQTQHHHNHHHQQPQSQQQPQQHHQPQLQPQPQQQQQDGALDRFLQRLAIVSTIGTSIASIVMNSTP